MELDNPLTHLAVEALVRGDGREPEDNNVSPETGRAFESAMQAASREMGTAPVEATAEVERTGRLEGAHGVGTYGAAEPTEGDAILGGIQSIRGMFDKQINRVGAIGGELSLTSAGDLIKAQGEMIKLSLMVEITSKLAGKLTQSSDTLLKG